MDINQIDVEIGNLEKQYKDINESDIAVGIKNEILKVIEQAKDNLINIRPIYENLAQINSFILEPTKKEIVDSFSEFKKQNAKLAKKNDLFSSISLMIGVVGLLLTIFSFVNPFANKDEDIKYPKVTLTRNTNLVNNVNDVLDNYTWLNKIKPDYSNNLLISNSIDISFDDGSITIELQHNPNYSKKLTDTDIGVIVESLNKMYKSFGVNINNDSIQLYSYEFIPNDYFPVSKIKFITKSIPVLMRYIYWKEDRNHFLLISMEDKFKFQKELFLEKNDPFFKKYLNRDSLISSLSSFLYIVSGNKFEIDKDFYYMALPAAVSPITEDVNPLLVFSKVK